MPLMEFPTNWEEERRIVSCTLSGFGFLGAAAAVVEVEVPSKVEVAAGDMEKFEPRESELSLSDVVAVKEEDEAPPSGDGCLGMALLTRLASNSTKTADGLISLTRRPANSALSEDI